MHKYEYVFDLTAYKIYQEKPKKGEENDGIEVQAEISSDYRKGYFPDDIANTFGVPLQEHKRQMEVSELDIDPASIRHILITHQDTDHVGALKRLLLRD